MSDSEAPSGQVADDSYIPSTSASKDDGANPVVSDNTAVEDNLKGDQDSEEQLAKDDNEAISEDNIIDERTRGAKPEGSYSEGPDEDSIPEQ